ncbi:MAG: aconitate hydratase AcnA [Acidobacteria bacterium]|nr:aconitate hydratase AcnA [Acidobacteriota bacterium]
MRSQGKNSFGTRTSLRVAGTAYEIHSLAVLEKRGFPVARLPRSIRILLENLLRTEDGRAVQAADIEALARIDLAAAPEKEIAFTPARVLLQDFTGVPCVADLAAMRDALVSMGGDPSRVNPLVPCELVIDHSVQVDAAGERSAFATNARLEFERNRERYAFLRWGQQAFSNFRVVPPDTGIVHQVNLEHLARVVMDSGGPSPAAYPDTVIGTDSHTTMINGLGVLGWGVGGIEAEAAMLGQPVSLLIPQVVGFKLAGSLPAGATATDLVLTVTQMLRAKGVVSKFVEFHGPGLDSLSLADRATLANMAPEYGATCGYFPVDAETLAYLRFTGRDAARVALVEAYAKEQGLFRGEGDPDPEFADTVEMDLATVVPSLAGPRRPQDRVPLTDVKLKFAEALPSLLAASKGPATTQAAPGEASPIRHGSVVIAAITSCTNTSNPSVMIGAGLLARKAVESGLTVKPWVKTSLAPGSRVVMDYLAEAGLVAPLEALRFHLVGYGCTTCIGNSGPLAESVSAAIQQGNLVAAAVLSGNRNFEGRIHPHVRANYLASPPLVVAYAIAGTVDIDLSREPLGAGRDGKPVYLEDVWPSPEEVRSAVRAAVKTEMFSAQYARVFEGDESWRSLRVPEGNRFAWDAASTYVRQPSFLESIHRQPAPLRDIVGARALAVLGDSVTTDHISPAGSIAKDSPAARYLVEHGVKPGDFNSYGSRRGNHEVMVRGTFANVRLSNLLAPGTEGGVTRFLPGGQAMSIYDASLAYREAGVPLVVLAGKEYGAGSSRDWAAKGPALLGVRAVLAESYERIHRSNLVGMGILPLQFPAGVTRGTLGLTGEETYSISGIAAVFRPGKPMRVDARRADGSTISFEALARIDTPVEVEYYRHGGILPFVVRQLA